MSETAQRSLLITGARVYTADPDHPWAQAIVIDGNRIHYVGTDAEARACADQGAERIHLPGALAVPGLNDGHVHMSLGAEALGMLNLEGIVTLPALQAALRDYAAAQPRLPWIEGYGVAYEVFDGFDRPEREALDNAVADRPVYLRAFDWHTSWANTLALRRAGIAGGAPLPRPNEVVVDPASGLATGMLKERLAQERVTALIDAPTPDQRDDALRQAIRYVNGLGITSIQNMDGDPERLAQYDRLHERGELTVRAYHYMSVREGTPRERLEEFAALTRRHTDPWNRTRGIKLFIDGVVESKTALLLEPYADGSDDTGVPDMDPEAYRAIVVAADALGMDVATHAIGDRGVRLALDAYEEARRANAGQRDRRHRVEHIEVSHPSDVPRFARLGVTASMQPLHAAPTGDPRFTPWTRLVGPAREPNAFAWRRLVETGAAVAFGSDWPIVTPDIRAGLHAAVTRANKAGEPPGGWQSQQNLTLAQALDAYTRGAAHAEAQDGVKGMLRAGMLADVTVFAQDLFAALAAEIPCVDIALTVVDGRIAYRAP
jgi:predicted amidohydrolase YtcJ